MKRGGGGGGGKVGCVTENQDVCSGYAFLHPTPLLTKTQTNTKRIRGKGAGCFKNLGILWLCYSLKTKEKGRGVCGN